MKINKYITLIIAGGFALSSCKKSFLVETPPTAVPVASSIKTENDLADAVSGMYVDSKVYELFGRDVPVLGDLLADNTYVSSTNYGRYLSDNNYSFIATDGVALDMYQYGYQEILQTNRIIAAAVPVDANVLQLKGEAYTMRALTYLAMINYFGPAYLVNSGAPGLPVITVPSYVTGPFITPARNTVAAVYKQIISDLDSAYLIMPTAGTTLHATNSAYLSKYAASAILSRAYLYEGDYADAITAALNVVQSGGYSLTTSKSAFTAYWANPDPVTNKQETIFELDMTATSNNGTNGLDAMYNQAGYGDLLSTDDLYNDYAATDYRKSLILQGSRGGEPALICNKYTNYTNSDKDEVKIIRYAEVLLTLAEAYAQTGDNADAQKYVNLLAENRDPSFTGYTDTGSALVTDILNERRKELAFEGLRFFDLKRLNLVINRPQEPYSYPSYPTVSVSDYHRLQPIPTNELTANPNIVQNPGY